MTELTQKDIKTFNKAKKRMKLEALQELNKVTPDFKSRNTKINSALDFKDKAYIGVYIPARLPDGKEIEELFLITDDKKYYSEQILKEKGIKLKSKLDKIESRWSLQSIHKWLTEESKVEFKEVFENIRKQYKFYIDFPKDEYYDYFSLWTIGTYFHPLFNTYPYTFLNALKESGKTKTLHLTWCLAFNAIFSGNMSTSTIFRLIQNNRCTLLIDETEKLSNPERAQEFRNILLNGYKSGGKVYRTEKERDKFIVKEFEPFSPKILANIRGMEDVLESRCNTFILKKTKNFQIGNREINENNGIWQELRDNLYHLTLSKWKEVKKTYNAVSELSAVSAITNRQWELWKPILTLAKLVSEEVYNKMFKLALKLSEEKTTENLTQSGEFLLVEAMLNVVDKDNYYSIKELKEKTVEYFDDEPKWLNSKWTGRALKRLGFTEKRRLGTGIEVRLNKDEVRDLAERLGIRKPVEEIKIGEISKIKKDIRKSIGQNGKHKFEVLLDVSLNHKVTDGKFEEILQGMIRSGEVAEARRNFYVNV